MYIYHELFDTQSVPMIYINLNTIFYTHVEHSHIKTIYIKCYIYELKKRTHKNVINLNIYDTDL